MEAFKSLLVVGLVWMAVGSAYGNSCCSSFSSGQEAFLRKILQDEAIGLKKAMMLAFSVPKVKWFKLSTKPVCFGARDNSFGSFPVKHEGFLSAIKLVHDSGFVTCDKRKSVNSNWGCSPTHPTVGKTSVNTLVTTGNNRIVFPSDGHFAHDRSSYWYNLDGFDSDSTALVFQRFHEPVYVAVNQELRLWYGEDLGDVSEADNGGRTCAQVFGFYL